MNTRLLQAERVAHDCGLGDSQFAALVLRLGFQTFDRILFRPPELRCIGSSG